MSSRMLRAAIIVCLTGLCGCLELDARVSVHEDGTATLTERVRYSRQLLDLAGERQDELLKLLGKEAATARLKGMGEGVTLVSHDLRDAAGASKEAVAVYKIADLNRFQYVSPWFAYPDFPDNNAAKFTFEPLYKSHPYNGGKAGDMAVTIQPLRKPVAEARLPEGAPAPRGPSPLENQVYRELAPLFRDMLKDVRVRFTFESYAPIVSGWPLRNRKARPTSVDLVNVSDKDTDQWGGPVLANEEVMIDLLRWHLGSKAIAEQVREAEHHQTLPFFIPLGSRHMWFTGGNNLTFRPSRQLFDRHFAGKMLDPAESRASPPDQHVPAKFEEIGFQKK